MTVSLYAEFSALPGRESQVRDLIALFANQVRAEPGNISFEPYTSDLTRGSIFVLEEYENHAAFAAHLSSSHGVEFNRQLTPLIAGGASRLTMLSPIGEHEAGVDRRLASG